MNDILLMAVDLGTSFIKVAVYDTSSKMLALSIEAVKDERPKPGMFIQKADDLFASAVQCMKKVCLELGAKAKKIEAISFTGQMSGFMGIDKNWNDITTWSCSLDNRYMPYAERQMRELKEDFLIISGTNAPQMAPKFEWFKTEFPEANKAIVKYLMISGYVIGKLGAMDIDDAVIDITYTEWTGLADIRKGAWSDKLCDAIELDKNYLPKIVHSNCICAYLSKSMADTIGLKSGIALVSGAGDKAAGCLGAAIVEPGDMIFEASSYGQISYCATSYRPDSKTGRLDCIPSPVPGYFLPAKFIAGSGITLDWYINTFVKNKNETLSQAFERMEEKMNDVPIGCDGVMAIGLLAGSSMPLDGSLRGLWMGHDWSHGIEHFYKALLESFAYDLALSIEKIDELYPEHVAKKVRVIGGGAKSPIWIQMNADVTGKTYQVLEREDAAMWAACLLAGNAIGLYDDLKTTAKAQLKIVKEYKPDLRKKEKYAPFKALYEESLLKTHNLFDEIQSLNGVR